MPQYYYGCAAEKKTVSELKFLPSDFLSLRPLPVLLDICIRHSFESQHRNIKVFSVPLNPTLEEKRVPRRYWGLNHKGKKNDQNKQTGGKLSEAVL